MPFTIKDIQVDGGSEFRSLFEDQCKSLNIPLFVLPPKKPNLNAGVERLNRTCQEEYFLRYYNGFMILFSYIFPSLIYASILHFWFLPNMPVYPNQK